MITKVYVYKFFENDGYYIHPENVREDVFYQAVEKALVDEANIDERLAEEGFVLVEEVIYDNN
jgi:hypothetical protein